MPVQNVGGSGGASSAELDPIFTGAVKQTLSTSTSDVPSLNLLKSTKESLESHFPIGAIRSDIGLTAVKSYYDILYATTKGKYLRSHSNTIPVAVIAANYPDIAKDTSCNSIQNRTNLFLASGKFGFIRNNSTVIQTTSDFSTYNNVEAQIDTVSPTPTGAAYNIDYDGSKVVRLGLGSAASGGSPIGYSYSVDGVTFNSFYGREVNGVYSVLSNPCISGSVYSFWSSLDNARIYTTDHINFTVCTNSVSTVVHKMSNGTLYCLTANGSTDFKYSTDNGQTWSTGTLPSAHNTDVSNHSIEYNGTRYVFVKRTSSSASIFYGTTIAMTDGSVNPAIQFMQVYNVNNTFFAFQDSTDKLHTSSDGITWTERTLSNATTQCIVYYAHSKYFVIGNNRVMSSSDLITWTSEIASGITTYSTNAMPRTFACASGNNLVFISSGTINIYQSGSWTAVTNLQQISGLATLWLGASNLFVKVKA